MRLIDADRLLGHLETQEWTGFETIMTVRSIKAAIKMMPVVDAEPVRHGRWIDEHGKPVKWDDQQEGIPGSSCFCSICGDWLTASDEYPVAGFYCSNCGAKMDMEEQDAE